MHSIFILTSNLKQIYRLLKLTVTCFLFCFCFCGFFLFFFFDKYLFIYKSFSYKSIPQVTIAKFIQMRKTNPITEIKRGKGFQLNLIHQIVSLLYFESQPRVTVSLRKQTYSSYGSLTRLISRENIDIGSDFKNIKRCFDHDDVDFKRFRKTKILGTCMYFFSLTLNCEVNPTLTVLYEQI